LYLIFFATCRNTNKDQTSSTTEFRKGSYGYDASLLKKKTKQVLELSNREGAKVLLSADYQGRVMTSTAMGDSGTSFGWLNYDLVNSGEKKKQFNPVGGEERFWLGPEGGQYALYFQKGDSFSIRHWQVPAIIDTVSYDLLHADSSVAVFSKKAELTNYAGTLFSIEITREVSLLDKEGLDQKLNTIIPHGIKYVAYLSNNTIKNTGSNDWTKKNGLLSIWLLGMMTPTEETKVIIPFSPVPNTRSFITDDYFGKIPADRLLVKDSVLYLRCDGKSRGKIGISPLIAKPLAASFDFKRNILTVLIPEVTKDAPYVNSKWELQKQPYKGDVINAYNDGPLKDGSQLGPFYEIESSSPAKELKKGEDMTYSQTTIHFQGDYEALRTLAQNILHLDLNEVKQW
jgi:hypothetical protein